MAVNVPIFYQSSNLTKTDQKCITAIQGIVSA